jgi:hypothetical protein
LTIGKEMEGLKREGLEGEWGIDRERLGRVGLKRF